MGKAVKETDELGNTTRAEYDQLGRLIKSYDAKGYATEFTYDNLGRVIEQKTPFEEKDGTVYYSVKKVWYDNNGNVVKERVSTNTSGETESYNEVIYTYDNRNRLVMTQANDGEKSNYTQNYYDQAGNLLRVYTGLHAPLTINGLDNVTAGADTEYAVTKYTYDEVKRLLTTTDALGQVKTNTYDLANGLLETTTDRNGQVFNFAYNGLGSITSNALSDGTNVETTTYGLTGQVLSKQNGTTTTYAYDKMNRLISENDTDYSFDDFGNRISMTDGTVTTNYTYDLNNRLSESNEVNGDITTNTKFFYDNNGNQITKATMVNQPYSEGMSGDYTILNTSDSFVALYEYNCYNQLVGVDTNGVVSSYAYAPDGLRHSKTVGGNTITFVYDNANVVEEITADGTNKYYRGIEIIKNDDNLYYLYNGQGDVSLLIDNAGTTVADYEFDAYGNQLEENAIYNPFGYRGEYTDTENGLIYLRARMYDSQTGRFINEDPIKEGYNWYLYCSSNLINFIDPLGLFDYDDRLSPSTKYNLDVKVLQNELAWLGYYKGDIDGLFGQQTLDAVNAYKNSKGLGNTGADWGVVGAQTWSSLGLTYRSKADIDAGVEISTKGLKQYKDFSKPINNALKETAEVAESKWRFNYKWFMSQVNHKKPWDIKREEPWNNTIGKDTYPGWGVKVVYDDYIMTPEELGNYTYGYIGAALGLTKTELYGGSWYAAGFPTSGADWDNEYNDWSSIKKGADDYK